MKALKYIYSAAAVLLGLSSCIYSYHADISKETDPTVVIEGEILVGGTSTIRLSYLTELGRYTTPNRPQGIAWIEDRDGLRYESSDGEPGGIISIPTETAVSGKQYRAVVEVDGHSYVSEWLEAAPKPTITDIHFDSNGRKVSVYVDVDAQECRSGYMGFSYEETWEFHSDFTPEIGIDTTTWAYYDILTLWPYYWCYRSSSSQQMVLLDYSTLDGVETKDYPILSFPATDSRNHRRYSILVKAFALSQDAYLYNKQTQEMSDLGGDLFTPEPGTLEGNLTCTSEEGRPVMGLVLAAEITSKRAFMDNRFLRLSKPDESILVEVTEDKMPSYFIDLNYRPVHKVKIEDREVVGWGPHRCINCLEAGGTQETPEFWNDEE